MGAKRAVIVGSGIVGSTHALEVTTSGWEITHLTADIETRRASAGRNVGLLWVGSCAGGPEVALAAPAQLLGEPIAAVSPDVVFRPNGWLTVATADAELALVSEAADRLAASLCEIELLDESGVRDVNPVGERTWDAVTA